ncbi:nucleotidyl transferase AbiEii/AbiGii toxin family protein [Isachenkonia alkalipeptolytica]|uniref:Nucleotidyl transferase AbiEii/AbiGii toxin family protein n=1 Tax=Isachenkonia alkalipeptolytica TaxID=2565777 RepID=A0AA44BEY2_9CLOT|nr:nucleotidyl transferase AbiEii/AbiGii toxin family protein [Isachenkonia alkalipeptolytica]NBG88635.1 nucleotidyl transferase AbiEii/AbiGii toxin family protein [Isachenkonia alkalipeptolytica]
MYLSNYDIIYLGKKAEELGFVRDTLEKVTRLADVLEYLNTNPVLKDSLALKGGTAINLTIFNLPRLSVDIDLDYLIPNSRQQMIESREVINTTIDRYMVSQGYSKNPRTKNPHTLDSWVYDYMGASGNKDNIKIEINYSLRSHVLEAEERPIITEHFSSEYKVKCLAPIEIYGSKINALLSRAAARDLYDARNMIHFGLFDESEGEMLKKCVIFYAAVSAKDINKTFDTKAIDSITQRKIKTDLLPVIKRKDDFELESAKKLVKEYTSELMVLTKEEKEFLDSFESGEYIPELLFEDKKILDRIKNHPMALWKTR